MISVAADGVIGAAMKSYIHPSCTSAHPDQRPLRPPKLNIAVLVVVLAASGACGCVFYEKGKNLLSPVPSKNSAYK